MSTVNSITTGLAEEAHQYDWRIRNFVMVQKNAELVGKQNFEINTGPTSAAHSIWNVGLKMNENKSHIGFYCKLVGIVEGDTDEIPMGLQISVRYRDGNTIKKSVQRTLKTGESCGFENVWTFDWPDWHRYTHIDASLTIHVILNIYAPVAPTRNTAIALHAFKVASIAKLQEHLGALLPNDKQTDPPEANRLNTDVKIISSDNKEFASHKLILAARSSYFAAMFSSGFSESSTGIITLDDISGKTVQVILHYIYTGYLLESWLEPDVIVEFTYAAGKYQFTEILELLDNLLGNVQEQTSQTSVVLLELANKLSLKKAESELLKRIVKFTVSTEKSEEFLSLIGNE